MSLFKSSIRLLKSTSTSSALTTPAVRTKLTTNLTGLAIHPQPLPKLLSIYSSTLNVLKEMPPSSIYRQSVESITNDRIKIIEEFKGNEGESEIELIENKIGNGCIEEVLVMAEGELNLAGKMLEWQPWSELEEPAAPGQWEPFHVTASTTSAEDLPPTTK